LLRKITIPATNPNPNAKSVSLQIKISAAELVKIERKTIPEVVKNEKKKFRQLREKSGE
jgi:hypothetical protein